MYLEGYSAWISIPGHELREFDVAIDRQKRRATCWIPSEAGMNFTVHWADHGWTIPTATFIKLDGYTVPGHFLMGKGQAARSNVRVGVTTVRPFTFAEISEENAHATPSNTNPAELGTIIVKIKRVELVGKHSANTPLAPRPPVAGRHSFGETPVGIGFGHEEMGPCQMPMTWKVKPYDKRNPGTYVTFVFRYRSRNFLISQGIMAEADDIHTNVHANMAYEDNDEDDSQYAESQYAESQCGESQYAESQYEESQYAESAPPSPTESSPPGTPAPSVLSGPSTPGSAYSPNVRPPRRPMSGRSVSLGEPPSRPSSAFPHSPPPAGGSSRSPPAQHPHPLIPPHVRERPDSAGARSPGTRRVVSYDAATARTISAHGHRSASITSVVASSQTAAYTSGAVSYYDLSQGQDTSLDSSCELSPTAESFSFSSNESLEVQASGERYHPNLTYSYDEDPKATCARNADPNVYLSSGYPGAIDFEARGAKEATAAPYDKANVIVVHDGLRAQKTTHHYRVVATTPVAQDKEHEEFRARNEPSILSLAAEAAKEPVQFPDVSEEVLARYARMPPRQKKYEYPKTEEHRTGDEPSILSLAAEAAKEPFQFPDVSEEVLARYASMPPPPKKREYSKTRPGPAMYLGQGPQKDITPVPEGSVPSRPGSEEGSPSRGASAAPTSNSAARRPSAGAIKGPSAKALAAEAWRAAEEEAARAGQARLDAARRRGYTPAVPIPRDLIFVDGDGARLPSPSPLPPTPPTRPPHLPTNRKASGEPVHR